MYYFGLLIYILCLEFSINSIVISVSSHPPLITLVLKLLFYLLMALTKSLPLAAYLTAIVRWLPLLFSYLLEAPKIECLETIRDMRNVSFSPAPYLANVAISGVGKKNRWVLGPATYPKLFALDTVSSLVEKFVILLETHKHPLHLIIIRLFSRLLN
jgi:hypothetical protein